MFIFPRTSTGVVAILFAAAGSFTQQATAEVTLPHIFGNHMVLQQEKAVQVWGWAKPGEAVTVQVGGAEQKTQASDAGEWKVTLPPMKAGGPPLQLTVRGTNTITLDDVLVGEVWLCSGQSNMEMGIKMCVDPEKEVAAANHPGIRLFMVPKVVNPTPLRDVQGEWKLCTPETVAENGWGGFTAAGYYFGRELHKTLKVPVGLIQSAWGGTIIEAWTPPAEFAATPELKWIDDRVKIADPTSALHKQRVEEYLALHEKWQAETRKALNASTEVSSAPAFPEELIFKRSPNTPTALYNGMIRALAPFALRGAIWYQGESNHLDGNLYTTKMKALVGGWRKLWNDQDIAFFYTQIAPYQYGFEDPTIVARFWQAQAAAAAVIPNSGMAGTMDIAALNDIHPKNKQDVGRRLALLALAKTYAKTGIVYSGPVFESMKIEGGKLRLAFKHTGGGLVSRDGKPVNWFEVIDAEHGGFVKADAVIDRDSVVVSAAQAPHPVAVQFGWSKIAEPNLANKEGLPALPFNAGEIPVRDNLKQIAEAGAFKVVYDLDLAKLGTQPAYAIDNHTSTKGPIDRIAYFMEVQDAQGEQQYIYASMDAFTQDLAKIGVPTRDSGAMFQQNVTALNVESNVKGLVTGRGLAGGNIEFWPFNYGVDNASKVPNASGMIYDFGDQPAATGDYGSMQVHNHDAKQTLFALNHWIAGSQADIGIGNRPSGGAPDWTFAANGATYASKRLRVLVHVKE